MENNLMNKRGVSYIILILTIIVTVILAGATILVVANNMPTGAISELNFKTDVKDFVNILKIWETKEYSSDVTEFDSIDVNADNSGDTYMGKTIGDIITSMQGTDYLAKFAIRAGELVYVGSDDTELKWSEDIGVKKGTQPNKDEDYKTSIGSVKVNKPNVILGLTPVYYDTNTNTWVKTTESDTKWYDYANKKWANAITKDGSMWVWIPRFKYYIPQSNFNTATAGSIQIAFEEGINTTGTGSGVGSDASAYLTHPAFRFASTELTGVWVAKFEASKSDATISSEGSSKYVKVVPSVESWNDVRVGTVYKVCQNMEKYSSIYGWGGKDKKNIVGINTHMIKNTEWSAVAYLTSSIYGANLDEVYINNNYNCVTGIAGDTASAAETASTVNLYNTTNGLKASSTKNVYGVYDMSGGAKEYTSAYVNNHRGEDHDRGAELEDELDVKYKDIYEMSVLDTSQDNFILTQNRRGQAIFETSRTGDSTNSEDGGWHGDRARMPHYDKKYFLRGGAYDEGTEAGIFSFDFVLKGRHGNLDSAGFRPVLAIGGSL